jgi:hypothetical protein
MSNEQNLPNNELDSLIGDNHLQMMKAALPYMNVQEQRYISFFIKFSELRNTINLFQDEEVAAMGICSAGEGQRNTSPLEILNVIKPFASPTELDFIDLMSNFLQGFRLAGAYAETMPNSTIHDPVPEEASPPPLRAAEQNRRPSASSAPSGPFGRMTLDQIKHFMPPEQQNRLETMQLMMSAMQQMN